MPNAPYDEYLDSPEWWSLRKLALQRADYQCERCRATFGLNVHHRTYQRIGAEYVNDLMVLCETCHREEHALRNKQKRMFELCGQARLFDRWDNPDGGCTPAAVH
jgi:5-methylcytosine-specific restriction endonuclease McrA